MESSISIISQASCGGRFHASFYASRRQVNDTKDSKNSQERHAVVDTINHLEYERQTDYKNIEKIPPIFDEGPKVIGPEVDQNLDKENPIRDGAEQVQTDP